MATPLKNQHQVEAGTEIGKGKCHACGGVVFITISKSGAAYYNCYNRSEKTGRPCQGHSRWGASDSLNIRRAYLVKSGQLQETKIKVPEAANLNKAPLKAVEPEPQKEDTTDEYGLGL
tara:strand:+ start:574 stop:927 length:354 start_codon:yes stop_codon:yes gene_type:complete